MHGEEDSTLLGRAVPWFRSVRVSIFALGVYQSQLPATNSTLTLARSGENLAVKALPLTLGRC
jgi:hypothetical protein